MTETRLLAAYDFGACGVSAMNVRSLFSTMRRVGEQKGVGSMFVVVQHASLPRGHASIRIQQYVGIITCMGLVLLRANDMDREDCTRGEESSSWESQSACHIICCVPYMVCLAAHGLLRSSVDINILTSLYSA